MVSTDFSDFSNFPLVLIILESKMFVGQFYSSYVNNIYNLGSISIDEMIVDFIADHSDKFCFIYDNYHW